MRIRNILFICGFIGIIIYGFYFKRKYFDPKYKIENAKREVESLIVHNEIRNGDLIFQVSLSRQSKAIQIATKSKYSHCGLIYLINKNYYVFEAIQPVKFTPLDKWIARGEGGKFVIKRLKNADTILTPEILEKMEATMTQFKGKDYDLVFEWSDNKMYCSELLWKIYQRSAGIEIGKLQKLKDFDLTNKSVQDKIRERYKNKIPLDETVISPASIYNSQLLVTVKSNE